jgi:hypothetical protein
MSPEESDRAAAAVAVAPRVTLDDIKANIVAYRTFTADNAHGDYVVFDTPVPDSLHLLTICVMVLRNGYTVVGTSACASPENFNAALGAKLAYEDALKQVWPLMGYALRDKLAGY